METADTTDTDSTCASTKDTNFVGDLPKLVNVLYPGYVKNVDKALVTLGGIKNIECATTADKRHLELCFKPNNLCSKPVLSDRDTKPQVLLKVKTKKGYLNGKLVSKEVTDYHVVGLTAVNIKFNRMCDFQYLPLVSKVPKEVEDELIYIYEDIMPKKLLQTDWGSEDDLDAIPLYFVPYQFSKPNQYGNKLQFDRSKFYEDTFKPQYCDKFKENQIQQKMSRKERDRFAKTTILLRIEDDIPQEPNSLALTMMKEKEFPPELVQKIHQLFAERPIWSRNALFYHTRASMEQMKFILPTIAFHYVSGPWRVLWVRFGYDPRFEQNAKLLQTFDYRVRTRNGGRIKIRSKRYFTPQNSALATKSKFSLSNAAVEPKCRMAAIEENAFILRPGLLPAARQTFFQYCDVKLQEIENMLAKLPALLPSSICDLKHGWLPNGFADQCREIVNKYISELVTQEIQQNKKDINADATRTDSDSSSSDSEISEAEDVAVGDIIDLETVEEINQMLGVKITSEPHRKHDLPGPSSAPH